MFIFYGYRIALCHYSMIDVGISTTSQQTINVISALKSTAGPTRFLPRNTTEPTPLHFPSSHRQPSWASQPAITL